MSEMKESRDPEAGQREVVTFGEAVDQFFSVCQEKPSSIRGYRCSAKRLSIIMADVDVWSIDERIIKAAIQGWIDEGSYAAARAACTFVRKILVQQGVTPEKIRRVGEDVDPALRAYSYLGDFQAKEKKEPRIPREKTFGALMNALEARRADPSSKAYTSLIILLMSAPQDLRLLTWEDVDLKEQVITFQPERSVSKFRRLVPLSRQAAKILEQHQRLSWDPVNVFSSLLKPGQPMTAAAVHRAFKRQKQKSLEIAPGGIREASSKFLERSGWSRELIDIQTAPLHRDFSDYRMQERQEMMQAWADMCDEMKAAAKAG